MGIISAAVTLLELNETVYVNWWGFPMCTKCSIKGCYHYCCHEYSWPLATYGHRDHLEIWFPHPTKGTHGCHGNTSKLAPRWAEETTDKGLRLSYIILRSITEAVSASSALRRENTHSKTDITKGNLFSSSFVLCSETREYIDGSHKYLHTEKKSYYSVDSWGIKRYYCGK